MVWFCQINISLIFLCNSSVFPCFNIPKYDCTVSCLPFFIFIFLNILFLVEVLKTLWLGKWIHPRKSTPEEKVLIKTLLG